MTTDPLIHMEGGSQGINPYSYIMNNPLSGTDPTGYDLKDMENTVSDAGADVKSATVAITATQKVKSTGRTNGVRLD